MAGQEPVSAIIGGAIVFGVENLKPAGAGSFVEMPEVVRQIVAPQTDRMHRERGDQHEQ
jgi:hypothetical protein